MTQAANRTIEIEPLTQEAFAPFGDVLAAAGEPTAMINRGMCARYSDLARLDFDEDGRAGVSFFHGQPYALPLKLEMVERHPLGSQAFVPMSTAPFLVVVAQDNGGTPARPRAFMTAPGQGVNYRRNTWHGVLTPLSAPATFAVVDRIGPGNNLEEHWFDEPWLIAPAASVQAPTNKNET